MDKGAWFVFHGRKPEQKLLGVQSEDFTHDVWLEVHGDFGPPEDKLAYCEWLAKRLNEEARIAELEATDKSRGQTMARNALRICQQDERIAELEAVAEATKKVYEANFYDHKWTKETLAPPLRAAGYLSE